MRQQRDWNNLIKGWSIFYVQNKTVGVQTMEDFNPRRRPLGAQINFNKSLGATS
jgi:hypothetical protein